MRDPVQRLINEFARLDTDSKGGLSVSEFLRPVRSPAARERARRAFRAADRRGEGRLSLREFAVLRGVALGGSSGSLAGARRVFEKMDADGSRFVSLDEMQASKRYTTPERASAVFQALDVTRTGRIGFFAWSIGFTPDSNEGDFSRYRGLTVAAAGELAESEKRPIRPVRIDGFYVAVTMDYIPHRVNLTVVRGVVTEAHGG